MLGGSGDELVERGIMYLTGNARDVGGLREEDDGGQFYFYLYNLCKNFILSNYDHTVKGHPTPSPIT